MIVLIGLAMHLKRSISLRMDQKSPIYYHRVDVDLLQFILSVYVVVGFLIKQLFHRRQSLILKK